MGEHVMYRGDQIKIGTGEDLYYLRADQVHLLGTEGLTIAKDTDYRYRFPFPTEDNIEPGEFDNPHMGVSLHSVETPPEVSHHQVQFVARVGFNVMLPCPLSAEAKAQPFTMHANGFPGPIKIVQQRIWLGKLVLVLECGACGHKFRCPTLADAAPYVEACVKEAETALHRYPEPDPTRAEFWIKVGQRITAGYNDPLPIPFR